MKFIPPRGPWEPGLLQQGPRRGRRAEQLSGSFCQRLRNLKGLLRRQRRLQLAALYRFELGRIVQIFER
jgi:hypothetical protein